MYHPPPYKSESNNYASPTKSPTPAPSQSRTSPPVAPSGDDKDRVDDVSYKADELSKNTTDAVVNDIESEGKYPS